MHEMHEHLPFDYAAIAFLTGWAWVVAACAAMFLISWVRELIRGDRDERDKTPGERPFMTPALRESLRKFPFQ